MLREMIILSLALIIGLPLWVGFMSFVLWKNEFKNMWKPLVRMIVGFLTLIWIVYAFTMGTL